MDQISEWISENEVTEEEVEEVIQKLLMKGRIYEPRKDTYKVI